jgi:hypothetical protein
MMQMGTVKRMSLVTRRARGRCNRAANMPSHQILGRAVASAMIPTRAVIRA